MPHIISRRTRERYEEHSAQAAALLLALAFSQQQLAYYQREHGNGACAQTARTAGRTELAGLTVWLMAQQRQQIEKDAAAERAQVAQAATEKRAADARTVEALQQQLVEAQTAAKDAFTALTAGGDRERAARTAVRTLVDHADVLDLAPHLPGKRSQLVHLRLESGVIRGAHTKQLAAQRAAHPDADDSQWTSYPELPWSELRRMDYLVSHVRIDALPPEGEPVFVLLDADQPHSAYRTREHAETVRLCQGTPGWQIASVPMHQPEPAEPALA